MLKNLASLCAASIVVAAFSVPAQARVAHAGGAHVASIGGARVATVHRGSYRDGAWRGEYGRYGYYRPGWGVAAGVAGAAVGAAAVANRYGYAYDNGYYGDYGYYGAGYYGSGGYYYGGYPNESHDAN